MRKKKKERVTGENEKGENKVEETRWMWRKNKA